MWSNIQDDVIEYLYNVTSNHLNLSVFDIFQKRIVRTKLDIYATLYSSVHTWRVWIYHRVNQNPYIEEEQTTQWPKQKVQKDKQQRSTQFTHKTKDRVTRTPLKTGDELMCSGRVSSSCSTSGTRRVFSHCI